MQRFWILGILSMVVLVLTGCSGMNASRSPGGHLSPEMVVAGPVPLDAKGKIAISGRHFQAGSEVMLLFTSLDGVQSDIGYALEPAPVVVGDDGTWISNWSYGRYVKKKLVKAGSYPLVAVDENFDILCETYIEFVQ